MGLAVPEEQVDLSIFECLLGQVENDPLDLSRITWQIAPNLDLAPSRANLAKLEPQLGTREDGDTLLHQLLQGSAERYDYCIVDCPPHNGLLMKNGLRAADEVIIPVDTGYFSLYGLTQQLATIEQQGERTGAKPTVRVLANQYDVRTKLAREIIAELHKKFQGVLYGTLINFNTKLKEGASFGQPITEFAPNSMGARDFQKLARELIAGEPARVHSADLLEHVERLAADADRLLATTATLVNNRADRTEVPNLADLPSSSPPARGLTDQPIAETRMGPHTLASASPVPETRTPEAKQGSPDVTRTPSPPKPIPTPQPTKESTSVGLPASGPADNGSRPTPPPFPSTSPQPISSAAAPTEAAASTPPSPAAPTEEPHQDIYRKITAIYGVKQDGDTVTFRSHNPQAAEVQLAGDFNDWMPHTTPMRRLPNGDFEARLRLPKGRYRYRLVIDGRWSHDQNNPELETNDYGELNSIVEVTR